MDSELERRIAGIVLANALDHGRDRAVDRAGSDAIASREDTCVETQAGIGERAAPHALALALGEDGQIVDQVALVETLRVPAAKLERFRREGVLYGMSLKVSQPGAYQLRVAVRDAATGRIGSASQYVEVPTVGKDKLALSSLVITGNNPQAGARARC